MNPPTPSPGWSLTLHGGAGLLERGAIDAEADSGARAGLDAALAAGSAILDRGGSALDAVEAAVMVLEDDPHFNAGRGAVFTYEGTIELDAAIMDGARRDAGSIARCHFTRNPVRLARAVMEQSPHVMLSGEGADRFSRETGLEQVDPDWFATDERRRQLDAMKARGDAYFDVDLKYGTVGAVARDADGHIAAATSTGGLTGKRYGRIGDSPILGAGTWADDRGAAISATGAGEYFIRVGVAQEISTRLRLLAAERPVDAADAQEIADAVMADVRDLGGSGGIIYCTPWGHQGFSFTTPGMYRAIATADGLRRVAIFGDEG